LVSCFLIVPSPVISSPALFVLADKCSWSVLAWSRRAQVSTVVMLAQPLECTLVWVCVAAIGEGARLPACLTVSSMSCCGMTRLPLVSV
jgi:hypothetical protein